jgi:hypothetical protein
VNHGLVFSLLEKKGGAADAAYVVGVHGGVDQELFLSRISRYFQFPN